MRWKRVLTDPFLKEEKSLLKSAVKDVIAEKKAVTVGREPVIEGKVKELRLLVDMLCLERLALIGQPVTDLSALMRFFN